MGVLIRQLTVNDAQAFWDLRLRGFAESPASFNTEPHEWRAHPLSEVERMLAGETGTPSDIVLGAFEPLLCGHVGLRRQLRQKRSHRATLWGMYVAPEVRGRGIGGRLLQALLDHARSQPDLIIIELTVMTDNHHAVRLYRRFGFQRFGYQQRATRVDDSYFDEEHLMLDLDAPLALSQR
ncbi:MAG TPA: GNAT family N-acetyltransferase [Polyangiaceae bacterium]|nr:GNAT family N-acetyltransferase [Polyangiaceae bacterium]